MNNYEKKEKIIDEAKKETDTKLTDSIANESIKQIQKIGLKHYIRLATSSI